MTLPALPDTALEACNLVAGSFKHATEDQTHELRTPYYGSTIGRVHFADKGTIDACLSKAEKAADAWSSVPIRERTRPLFRYKELLENNIDRISELVALESGKLIAEAKAGILKGLEIVEFSLSLENLDVGGSLEVSRGVVCQFRRIPRGVCLGITPFNFPAMVPMWLFPIAVTLGNAFVLKPSEKVPLAACELGKLMIEAGYPEGVFNILHGGKDVVETLLHDPRIQTVAFVGSTPIAQHIYQVATAQGKRALCLGGAKNHILLAPDADPDIAVPGIVDSFTGCAGQRCMAASVLLPIGNCDELIHRIVKEAQGRTPGVALGALIDSVAKERIINEIDTAKKEGARILLDGRKPHLDSSLEKGSWLAPTIIDEAHCNMQCWKTEIFGPVLTIIRTENLDEALAIEKQCRYGNATSIFTRSGALAHEVSTRASTGMVGVNIGVPVPRDPFSFGGFKDSHFGQGDITGESALALWSDLRKVTTKWNLQTDSTWMTK